MLNGPSQVHAGYDAVVFVLVLALALALAIIFLACTLTAECVQGRADFYRIWCAPWCRQLEW